MNRPEQSSTDYDKMFADGGHEGVYHLPYRRSCYFPLFKAVLREVRNHDCRSILEVGCGTGAFAEMVGVESAIAYRGFDFSAVAVEQARQRIKRPEQLYVGDATLADSYMTDYDAIVCTEVLEHIDADLDVITHWKPGTITICSVPNFDAANHVRFFETEMEVYSRYGDLVDIEAIRRIRKPELTDISLRSYLRAIRWNRYRPRRLREILGLTSFAEGGGWFLFVGRRLPNT